MSSPNLTSMFYAAALLATDDVFLKTHGNSARPDDFPDGPLRELTRLVLHHWEEHQQPFSRATLDAYLEHVEDDTAEEIVESYEYCVKLRGEKQALPLLREKADEWFKTRWVGRAVDDAAKALAAGDVTGAVDALQTSERRVNPPSPEMDLESIGQVIIQQANLLYIPTGLAELDAAFEGGIRPSEFGIVLGGTNVGKSLILCMWASNAYLSNKRVLFYTSELTREQIIRRCAAAAFKVSLQEMEKPERAQLYTEVLSRVKEMGNLNHAYLKVRQMESLAIPKLLADIRELEEAGEKPDIIFLDTADDMTPPRKSDSTYTALGSIYQALRTIVAQETGVAVWTSTQTHRDAVDKAKLSLRNVADSFIKIQRAHYCVGLAQSEQELKAPMMPRMRVLLLKDTQHGQKGHEWKYTPQFGRDDTPAIPLLISEED